MLQLKYNKLNREVDEMKWGKLKEWMESEGVTDEMLIDYIDVGKDDVIAVDVCKNGIRVVGCD